MPSAEQLVCMRCGRGVDARYSASNNQSHVLDNTSFGRWGALTRARPRCAYHGWRFDSNGKCLRIPQSESGGKDEIQAAACAKAYPTQVTWS